MATVLFADIVGSTELVATADPEVARRRVMAFFDRASRCVELHGGTVEKFAGDAVLAAFGVAHAHEDDAERAVRAGLAILEAVPDLALEARVGIEAGEVVVDAADSTFATGEAVHVAARLQQLAAPGEILMGPVARRLTEGKVEAEERGLVHLRGLPAPLPVWRALTAGDVPALRPAAPLVGRDWELELLANTFHRACRDGRASLFTIYGDPGVGKSRLAREFVESLEGATVLAGRCLPYGEGITFWPLAEMVKTAAGISDDDPVEEAFRKLRACCEDEAVADLLGLASGVLEAVEGGRSQEEIAWAAAAFAERLAEAQPLVLLFEDIHWGEEPLLQLIEHLADTVHAPLLLLCLARPELLEGRPSWGGGRVRSTAIALEPLGARESEELLEALAAGVDRPLSEEARRRLLAKTEGNPLFLEETVRMLADRVSGGDEGRIPDTLQALIAARIDRLPAASRALLRRAAVVGRVFWGGALVHLAGDLQEGEAEEALRDLVRRELVLPEPRSSISGEEAFRFKHVLIREVAYQGLAKSARAEYHARFARWLGQRAGPELVEIRAHHLDRAAALLAELDGEVPAELAQEGAAALAASAKRALAREAYATGRRLALRSVELHPALQARYLAARAAWRMQDLAAVEAEMPGVVEAARREGERWVEGMALTALGEAALRRRGDIREAAELVDRALELLSAEKGPDGLFDALLVRAAVSGWLGEPSAAVGHLERARAVAAAAGRKDLQTVAGQALAQLHILRLDLEEAGRLLAEALTLAEESGSVRGRVNARLTQGWYLSVQGDLEGARAVVEEARGEAVEAGLAAEVQALARLAAIARLSGDLEAAERHARQALRVAAARGEHGPLSTLHAELSRILAQAGKVEEAEVQAMRAAAVATADDPGAERTVQTALAAVRAAQGRAEEAEELLVGALESARRGGFAVDELDLAGELARLSGRGGEAASYEARVAELARARRASQMA